MRVLILTIALLSAGCVSYERPFATDAPPQLSLTQDATVVEIHTITVERPDNPFGATTAAVMGALGGALVGQATGSCLATVALETAGMFIGSKMWERSRHEEYLEIHVSPDGSEQPMTVTQKADQAFSPGEHVRIYTLADGTMRVAKAN